MTPVSRRHVLGGAAALAMAASSTVRTAVAQSPGASNTEAGAPGLHRIKIGDIEITSILDGVRRGKLVASPSRSASLEQYQEALAADNMPRDEIALVFHPLLIKTGDRLIMIDTGNGPRTLNAGTGLTAQRLAAAGVDPAKIDTVIISHFHGDHIGGLVTLEGAPAFPNAEIKVPLDEWNYWLDDANMNKAAEGSNLRNAHANVRRVFGAIPGKYVTKFGGGKEVAPGITAMATPGHTPGHTSFIISSGSHTLLVQADVTSGVAVVFVRHPDWFGGGDMDGPQAVATRRKLYDMLAAEKMPMAGYHLPFPALGRIEKSGGGYSFVPAA
ncbi:MBL fold metallo-hydrolase [Pseudorhodoplanes sp.]|jgi:glyoxylase-like metal-dependent hydrolase (beta-lactamase superfamily II)|uniref:MBL fold metallo-hydrolase n=1 Tax=Pseudorhodoplanes sp. TaxID=1934341 RepID=UPI002B89A7A6|nr:MBL fold metallo-hydrolase [Pseudorhodoplanes sp.]HWV40658.1 MBL fold metallo-hydrolase [Pseudorhodoplanes sp.]